MGKIFSIILVILAAASLTVIAQEQVKVYPTEIDDVLINPGIGFNTFQRFNGDTLNPGSGWTEGKPIVYQDFDGDLTNPNYPASTTAYFRVWWRYIEPKQDEYRWDMIDKALKTAAERGQTLLLRIAPYGSGEGDDIPDWLRDKIGPSKDLKHSYWRCDPEDPVFLEHWTGLFRDLGARYDGHPDLELVDMAIVGFWGESAGSNLLSEPTRRKIVDAYIDSFKKTNLVMLLTDARTNGYGISRRNVGWRVDCIGDLGFWAKEQAGWTHMYDYYPRGLVTFGMQDAWKEGPVTLESCGTMMSWKLKQGYNAEQVQYIIDQTLKWHISSFTNKSSPVPEEWMPMVNDWLKKMGYRFVLRKIAYPSTVAPHDKLAFETWWENKGVAPAYREFPLALRLKGARRTEVLLTDADVRDWLPGDIIYDSAVYVPLDMPEGDYQLGIALLDPRTRKPIIKLAIEGMGADGWYDLGKIVVKNR